MNIENIHIGDHLVIIGRRGESYDGERIEIYGGPAKVAAICPPYIAIRAVEHPRVVRTIDIRLWEVTKASDEYANEFKGSERPPEPTALTTSSAYGCPVCSSGRFVKVYPTTQRPFWRCTSCESVIVEQGLEVQG